MILDFILPVSTNKNNFYRKLSLEKLGFADTKTRGFPSRRIQYFNFSIQVDSRMAKVYLKVNSLEKF
ncbi:hypothetical protein B6U96_17190 [Archaeoglobales archaeon ex4484_92]|nr:MAG: hypothetical protein B6U96_17190 [Archaeoglobales archaeon ex4484_92]